MGINIFELNGAQAATLKSAKAPLTDTGDQGFTNAMTEASDRARSDSSVNDNGKAATDCRTYDAARADETAKTDEAEKDTKKDSKKHAHGNPVPIVPTEATGLKNAKDASAADKTDGGDAVPTAQAGVEESKADKAGATVSAGAKPMGTEAAGADFEKAIGEAIDTVDVSAKGTKDGTKETAGDAGKDAKKAADGAAMKAQTDAKAGKSLLVPDGMKPVNLNAAAPDAAAKVAAQDGARNAAIAVAQASKNPSSQEQASTGKQDAGGEGQGGNNSQQAQGVGLLNARGVTFEPVAKAGEVSATEHAEIFEKLSTGVKMSMAKGGGEVRLSLKPENLGHLNIRLNIGDNGVKAFIQVENTDVKHALENGAAALKEVFVKNGLVLHRFSVEVATGGFSMNTAPDPGFSGSAGYTGNEHGNASQWNGNETSQPAHGAGMDDAHGITAQTQSTGSIRRASGIDVFI